MSDEFQTGICRGRWWNSSRNGFNEGSSSPCSTTLTDAGSFGWPTTEMVDVKTRPCEDSASVSGSSIVLQDSQQKPQESDSGDGGGSVLPDSTLQMMGFGFLSTMDWNQPLLRSSARAECNFHSMLQEEDFISSSENFRKESPLVQKEWSPKNFSSGGDDQDSSITSFKQINQTFGLDHHQQQRLNSGNNSGDSMVTFQALPPTSFTTTTTNSSSYGCPSTLIHSFFEPESSSDNPSWTNHPSPANYRINSNESSACCSKFPHQFLNPSSPKQQPYNQFYFCNNTPSRNPSVASMNDVGSSLFRSPPTPFLTPIFNDEKPNCSNIRAKSSRVVCDSSSVVKRASNESSQKRPRSTEPPSPLPTFKVRKEKLGDRITALQRLVSPFGKTDTASVLFEAIEYIKFLHDQVSELSTPYMKNEGPTQYHKQDSDKSKEPEGTKQDLRSQGLCLVPVSSTFPVTNEIPADFWTPTFGGIYR